MEVNGSPKAVQFKDIPSSFTAEQELFDLFEKV